MLDINFSTLLIELCERQDLAACRAEGRLAKRWGLRGGSSSWYSHVCDAESARLSVGYSIGSRYRRCEAFRGARVPLSALLAQLHPRGVGGTPCALFAAAPAPPRNWREVQKPVGLRSDAEICVKCAERCTSPSSPLIPLQINSLPPESSLLSEEAAPDGVLSFFFFFPSCQQPGFSVAAPVSPGQERSGRSRLALPERSLGRPCPAREPPLQALPGALASINRFDD